MPVRCADCGYLETRRYLRGEDYQLPTREALEAKFQDTFYEHRCSRAVPDFDAKTLYRRWYCVKSIERRYELSSAKEHLMIERMEAEQRRQTKRQARQARQTAYTFWVMVVVGLAAITSTVVGLANYFGW